MRFQRASSNSAAFSFSPTVEGEGLFSKGLLYQIISALEKVEGTLLPIVSRYSASELT
jgi:hypothetical protein